MQFICASSADLPFVLVLTVKAVDGKGEEEELRDGQRVWVQLRWELAVAVLPTERGWEEESGQGCFCEKKGKGNQGGCFA